jgi:beta-glucanase (GH16 family)
MNWPAQVVDRTHLFGRSRPSDAPASQAWGDPARIVGSRLGRRRSNMRTRFLAVTVVLCTLGGGAPATAARDRPGPRLSLLQAPSRTTYSTTAVFRLRTDATRIRCSRDGSRFRRCRRTVVYKRLSPGRHRFVVHATRGRRTVSRRVRWTVLARTPSPSPSSTPPSASGAPSTPTQPTGRTLVFEDDFNGTTLDTASWTRYNAAGNGGHGLRRPEAISLDGNGNLVFTAQMSGGQIVSGGMALRHDYTYGRYEFRVRTEADPTGTMNGVVLTWPQSGNWPTNGENDMYETGNAINNRNPFHSYVHYDATNKQYYFDHAADGAQWHTIAMDWTATAIKIYRDDALVWTVTDPAAIADVPHHICIQLDAMATRTLTQPVHMYVDYVRIYR